MKPADWNELLDFGNSWEVVNPIVAREARAHLELLDGTISTRDLVEALYPAAFARGDAITRRSRLYKTALPALAKHDLQDCATRGPETPARYGRKGQKNHPWLWHAPRPVSQPVCPHCGGPL
jgi:hypothetical protein